MRYRFHFEYNVLGTNPPPSFKAKVHQVSTLLLTFVYLWELWLWGSFIFQVGTLTDISRFTWWANIDWLISNLTTCVLRDKHRREVRSLEPTSLCSGSWGTLTHFDIEIFLGTSLPLYLLIQYGLCTSQITNWLLTFWWTEAFTLSDTFDYCLQVSLVTYVTQLSMSYHSIFCFQLCWLLWKHRMEINQVLSLS